MIDKRVGDLAASVAPVHDGAVIMIGGFGSAGIPFGLIDALVEQGARGLTIISNNAGAGEEGISALLREGRVAKVICSYPRTPGSIWFEKRYEAREVELEIVPQGTLAERLRAGGAGIPAFYTPTGVGTPVAEGKPTAEFDGRTYLLERGIVADVALVHAYRGDSAGNLVYRYTARNYNPLVATAGRLTVVDEERRKGYSEGHALGLRAAAARKPAAERSAP